MGNAGKEPRRNRTGYGSNDLLYIWGEQWLHQGHIGSYHDTIRGESASDMAEAIRYEEGEERIAARVQEEIKTEGGGVVP